MDIKFDDLDNRFQTTLDGAITDTSTTINLKDVPANTSIGFLAIDADDPAKIEFVNFTAKGEGFVSVPASGGRGQCGTLAQEHSSGAVVRMYVMREHIKPLLDKITLLQSQLTVLPYGISRQGIINGDCKIAQRTAPNLSTNYQYGQVDRFAAKGAGTAVSAGTISQVTGSAVSLSGYALKLAGVTVTGTGIVYARYRMEAKDAINYKNLATSFNCQVKHDVGSNRNYTIYVRKATGADNFTSMTDIANSGAISVASGVKTALPFLNINAGNIGDVSNGIEIEIKVECGAVTTKNFEFGEFQFNKGDVALPFQPKSYEEELSACLRYALPFPSFVIGQAYTSSGAVYPFSTPVQMRAIPTATSGVYTSSTPGYATPAGTLAITSISGNLIRFDMSAIVGSPLSAGNATVLSPPAGAVLSAEL